MDGSRALKKMRSASASDVTLTDEMQIEGAPHVNWKDGYTLDAEGRRQPLSSAELEKLRRERNRMHAKVSECEHDIRTVYNVYNRTMYEIERQGCWRAHGPGGLMECARPRPSMPPSPLLTSPPSSSLTHLPLPLPPCPSPQMTRDRKKRLIADLEQTIAELETKNRSRRQALGSTLARNLSHNSLTRFGAQYGVTGDEGATSRQ